MNKEELIKLIENMEIKKIEGFQIHYYDKDNYGYCSEPRELKSMSFNKNLNNDIINLENRYYEILSRINELAERCDKNVQK